MAYRWRWILALLVILLLPVSVMRVHAADHGKPVHHTAGDKGDQKGGEDKDDGDDADDDEDGDDDEDCDGDDGDDDDTDEDEDDADEDDDGCDGDEEDDDDADDGDAEDIDVADLPQAVVDAVNAALPGATIEEAERETEDGVVIYGIVVEQDGTSYELRIDDTGTLLSKTEEPDDNEDDD